MKAFIFQAKPAIYPLKEKLEVDREVGWLASRYRDLMERGKIVYYWSAGKPHERGIYGWGEITSDKPFIDSNNISRVAVTCRKILPKPITIDHIQDIPALLDLQIIQSPMGTNFLINDTENNAIIKMIQYLFDDSYVPPNN